MAKFVYKMQNILNIKYQLESQAKIAFSTANAKLREEEDKLMELMRRKDGYEQQSRELVNGGTIHILEIQSCRDAIEAMQSAIRAQTARVQVAEKNVDAARQKLNDVMIERKTHEKLREKAFEEFKEELGAEENKAVDELVSYSYQKNAE
ncbi:MAG: flagellar export protein FliJ [Lachnospiraceae bacterium]